jgi:HSP20 family protein
MPEKQTPVPIHHGNAFWPNLFEPLRQVGAQVAGWFQPDADAAHSEDAYDISIELPGVKEADIDISLKDGVLTIKGEKTDSREEKNATYYFSERSYGSFQRAFRVPEDVDTSAIAATFDDGVLALKLPRQEKKASDVQKISIAKN